MVTTEVSLKDGGKSAVQTSQPTMYSGESSDFQRIVIDRSTRDTSQAQKTQQTAPCEDSTPTVLSCLTPSSSLTRSSPSSSMFEPGNLVRETAMGHLVCRHELDDDAHSTQTPAAKQRKVVNARP